MRGEARRAWPGGEQIDRAFGMHEDGQDVAFVALGEDWKGAIVRDQLVLTIPDLDGEVACRTGFGLVALLIEIAGIIGKGG